MARNDQSQVHAAAACAQSVAGVHLHGLHRPRLDENDHRRLPVLLLPSDVFATRAPDRVLQQLEDTRGGDVSVNDAFRPVSKYFDRITRPEQLIPAALAAMRALTDPVETDAVTLCLPQDVQAEVFDWPEEFFRHRVWRVGRPVPEGPALEPAIALLKNARKPLIVAAAVWCTPRPKPSCECSPTPPASRWPTRTPASARDRRGGLARQRCPNWTRPARPTRTTHRQARPTALPVGAALVATGSPTRAPAVPLRARGESRRPVPVPLLRSAPPEPARTGPRRG